MRITILEGLEIWRRANILISQAAMAIFSKIRKEMKVRINSKANYNRPSRKCGPNFMVTSEIKIESVASR